MKQEYNPLNMPKKGSEYYRPNVGIVLFNHQGKVFIGRRLGMKNSQYSWQMPQGGIDPGETAEQAAIRELEEETGVIKEHIQKLGEIDYWLYYDFPEYLIKKNKQYKNKSSHSFQPKYWLGQKQKWFAFRFIGEDIHIKIATKTPEFDRWKWSPLSEMPDKVIEWKQQVYKEVAKCFLPFSNLDFIELSKKPSV